MTMRDVITLTLALLLLGWLIDTKAGECENWNWDWDHWKVAKALQQGLSKETLLQHLNGSIKELGVERVERIQELIDEVYQLPQTEAQSWWERHHKICKEDDEA